MIDKSDSPVSVPELEQRVYEQTLQLQAANKALESFAHGLAHNLRAPLRHITGFSQALLEDYQDKLDDTGKHFLRRLCVASDQMTQLVEGMTSLARSSHGAMTSDIVDLSAICGEEISRLKDQDPSRIVSVNIERGLVAYGDRRLLQTVLSNLLGNAWKFTSKRQHSEIAFGHGDADNPTCYFVRDNGAGFHMDHADKLFGVFQRLHAASEFEGAGVGLATVQRIIHRHGGSIRAEAAIDQGATFYFTIPPAPVAFVGHQSGDPVRLNSNNHE